MTDDLQLQTILVPMDDQDQSSRKLNNQKEELERYIGIRHHFPDPYHIYLHEGDLQDRDRQSPIIRFVIYSMGKKKVIMTGIYRHYTYTSSNRSPFHITYACRYNTRDLMTYVNEFNERFINTLNVMKSRIASRVDQFLDITGPVYLQNRDDYVQLKAWLTLQPISRYHQPNKDTSLVASLITPNFHQRIQSAFSQFNLIRDLDRRISMAYLADEDTYELEQDVQDLLSSVIQILDEDLSQYESRLNIQSVHTRSTEVVEISRRFAQWLQTSPYTSDTWVQSLQQCKCDRPNDIGCQILAWGDDTFNNLI